MNFPTGDLRVQFGRAVRERRLAIGLTQEQLAHKCRLNRSYITDIERGARNPALINVARLVHALDMSIPEFFRTYELDCLQ